MWLYTKCLLILQLPFSSFTTNWKLQHWLDLAKNILKQVKGTRFNTFVCLIKCLIGFVLCGLILVHKCFVYEWILFFYWIQFVQVLSIYNMKNLVPYPICPIFQMSIQLCSPCESSSIQPNRCDLRATERWWSTSRLRGTSSMDGCTVRLGRPLRWEL